MKIKKQQFGIFSDGTKVNLFTVSNDYISFSVTDFGATITSIIIGKGKHKTDVVLGYSTLDGYIKDDKYFGATIARFAGRISGAAFDLNGETYKLDDNANGNSLHGGFYQSSKMMWSVKQIETKKYVGVKCTKIFADGEQGFPGNLKVTLTYKLDEKNRITCTYEAETDKPTPINITNHSYFNLAGKGSVLNHKLRLNCKSMLESNEKLLPTGKIIDVAGTPFDFTEEKEIGKDISQVGIGYDNCFVTEIYDQINKASSVPLSSKNLVRVAELTEPKSGIKMTVDSNMEGVQVYTSNFIEGVIGKNGIIHHKHDAVCMETQCFPDSPNRNEFPSCILMPGEKYCAVTVFGFEG